MKRCIYETLVAVCVFLILSLLPDVTLAQTNDAVPELFEELKEAEKAAFRTRSFSPIKKVVIRERLVKLNTKTMRTRAFKSKQNDQSDKIRLTLFKDTSVDVTTRRMDDASSGLRNWVGHTEGSDFANVTIVVDGDKMTGNISINKNFYLIRPLENGIHRVIQVDRKAFPKELEPDEPVLDKKDIKKRSLNRRRPNKNPVIDVMVVYTNEVDKASTNIEAEIALAILETNVSFSNSGINARMKLVHTAKVDYPESGDMRLDRDRLQNPSDNFMDEVHELRNKYSADLVSLWIENNEYCGIAYIMNPVSEAFSEYGFQVTSRQCATGYFSFGHEFGHILGARHDRVADPTDGKPFDFNHGYVNLLGRWRTIMGYNSKCAQVGLNCTRIQFWSNPDIKRNNIPMGISIGSTSAADNRSAINRTAAIVADFR